MFVSLLQGLLFLEPEEPRTRQRNTFPSPRIPVPSPQVPVPSSQPAPSSCGCQFPVPGSQLAPSVLRWCLQIPFQLLVSTVKVLLSQKGSLGGWGWGLRAGGWGWGWGQCEDGKTLKLERSLLDCGLDFSPPPPQTPQETTKSGPSAPLSGKIVQADS